MKRMNARSAATTGVILCMAALACGCVRTPGIVPEKKEPAVERPAPPVYLCRRVKEGITIDGVLDELDWERASRAPLAIRHNTEGKRATRPMGYAKMVRSDEVLYLAFDLRDHDVRAEGKERDGAGTEPPNDIVLVFIDVNNDSEHFLEFQMNPLNALNDLFILRPRSKSPLSERLTYGLMFFKGHDVPEHESAVKIKGTVNEPGDTDQGWTAELMLPFKSLMMPGQKPGPAGGDIWRVQIVFQTGTDKGHRYHVWAPSFNAWHHHCIDHWGRVIMGD